MSNFDVTSSLINRRINDNLLKVKDENSDVKRLLSVGTHSAKAYINDDLCSYNDALNDIDVYSRCTSRVDLLRTCIILATSRNSEARNNLMEVIRIRLGRIKDKDYKYIANLIHLKDPKIVERVNNYLSHNLKDYYTLYRKYYKQYYGF